MADEIARLLANRTTLMAGISHDLRTPLTRMRLALELLPGDVDPALVQRFRRNLEAMDVLVGDALRFARGTGETSEAVTLAPYVRSVLETFDQKIELLCEIDDELTLALPPNAFTRVLVNLVGNGIKYANQVSVSLSANDIIVSDDGPGIAEHERSNVFEPFYRLEASRSQSTGGSGLGLAVVQQLSSAHGWRIEIRDAKPRGAAFHWQLHDSGAKRRR
jgi:two-component system osmolarity sensor histidine kinase EnvZ